MRGNEFLDKMGLISPAYVEAADAKIKKKRFSRINLGAVAACLAVMLIAGTMFFKKNEPEIKTELPMLTFSENTQTSMGYEGYMAYDISELVNANPWNKDSDIAALPVYKNTLTYDKYYIASGADFDKMREFILDVARRLGLDTKDLTVTDNAPTEDAKQKMIKQFEKIGDQIPEGYFDPTKFIIKTDGITIEVDQSMTAHIAFVPAVALPDQYNFTHFASYNETLAVADYFMNTYSALIGTNDPKVNIYGGDYNIFNQQSYQICFFDAGESSVEEIINYNFNRVEFYCDDNGALFMIRVFKPNLSNKLGDYPIISPEQAKGLLLNGNYISNITYKPSDSELVKKVELVYRTGEHEEYYMPYFRFYVELPAEERENGLKDFGAYYVPAVEGSYISNMPTWNGSFNQ